MVSKGFFHFVFINVALAIAFQPSALAEPLLTFKEQLEAIKYECRFIDSSECAKKKQEIRRKRTELVRFCMIVPEDESCGQLKGDISGEPNIDAHYCIAHPENRECIRKKKERLEENKDKQWACTLNPHDISCNERPQKGLRKPRERDLREECKKGKMNMLCKRYFEYLEEQKKKEEAKKPGFAKF